MDLQDQLKKLFPDHTPELQEKQNSEDGLWIQDEPILCKYEKRNGKPLTILEGYTGAEKDFRLLTQELKKLFSVGGSYKDDKIILQGDFRDKIMKYLQQQGFKVKRVGG